MSKGKLAKFADMAANPLVIESPQPPSYPPIGGEGNPVSNDNPFPLWGRWKGLFFKNDNPIVLELGCGRGEYTVGLARRYPDKNFIGVDIKGARMWTGAQDALNSGLKNVGFLRTHIEFIDRFFAPNEVSEIWLTFSDPQMKKATKRLTSTYFLERYRRFLTDNGIIHLKTDSNFLFTYTEEMLKANGLTPEYSTRDLYAATAPTTAPLLSPEGEERSEGEDSSPRGGWEGAEASSIQTYYEQMWRDRGIDIKYLRFRLPHEGLLEEPNVEIPLDEYRSYNRSKRSGNETGK